MALLPTLSTQIFEAMDVESISQALVAQSKRPEPQEVAPQTAGPAPQTADPAPQDGTEAAAEVKDTPHAAAADAVTPGGQPDSRAMAAAQEPPVTAQEPAAVAQKDEASSATLPNARPDAHRRASSSALDRVSEQPPAPISSGAKLPINSPSALDASPVSVEERRATKLRLWNDIKRTSFERTLTSLYTLVFLTLQTYIQLNMLGRRAYIAALETQAKRNALLRATNQGTVDEQHQITLRGDGIEDVANHLPSVDEEMSEHAISQDTEKKYLSSSYWFLHRGWQAVADSVQRAVQDEVADMPLKTLLSFAHFEELITRLRARVERAPTKQDLPEDQDAVFWNAAKGFENILFPESHEDEFVMLRDTGAVDDDMSMSEAVTPSLRALLDETKDYIDSPDFAQVFTAACDSVFELFVRNLGPAFGVRGDAPVRQDKSLLLAKVLPLVSQQAQVALNSSPNTYLEAIIEDRQLRGLSVLIYSAWDDELTDGPLL